MIPVVNPDRMREALLTRDAKTERRTDNQFHPPFSRVGRVNYPNGLINILCAFVTPIDDRLAQRIQFFPRNDTEADVSAEKAIAFDVEVGEEDRRVVETTDEDMPLDASEGVEFSMASDLPGLKMRRRLCEALRPA